MKPIIGIVPFISNKEDIKQIVPDTLIEQMIPCKELSVNSCHHQAIKELAPDFTEGAHSEDGLIEAAYMPDKKFVVGLQWHPEFALDAEMCSENIFETFLKNCK